MCTSLGSADHIELSHRGMLKNPASATSAPGGLLRGAVHEREVPIVQFEHTVGHSRRERWCDNWCDREKGHWLRRHARRRRRISRMWRLQAPPPPPPPPPPSAWNAPPSSFWLLLVAAATPLLLWLLAVARKRYLIARLPKLPTAKLTREALMLAARDYPSLVRLPGEHGVLVTDPSLARRLLEAGHPGGVTRDIAMYDRYEGFLGGSLVLLPQSSPSHRALRTALLPLFSPAATRRMHDTLLQCAHKLVDKLEAKAIPAPASEAERAEITKRTPPAPVYRLIQHFVLDVTMRCFLATPADLVDADAKRLIALFEEWIAHPPPKPGQRAQQQPRAGGGRPYVPVWLGAMAAHMPWVSGGNVSKRTNRGGGGGGSAGGGGGGGGGPRRGGVRVL